MNTASISHSTSSLVFNVKLNAAQLSKLGTQKSHIKFDETGFQILSRETNNSNESNMVCRFENPFSNQNTSDAVVLSSQLSNRNGFQQDVFAMSTISFNGIPSKRQNPRTKHKSLSPIPAKRLCNRAAEPEVSVSNDSSSAPTSGSTDEKVAFLVPVRSRTRPPVPSPSSQCTDLEQFLKPRSTRTPHTASILKRTAPAVTAHSDVAASSQAANACEQSTPVSELKCASGIPVSIATATPSTSRGTADNSESKPLTTPLNTNLTESLASAEGPVRQSSKTAAAGRTSLNATKLMQDRAFDTLLRNLAQHSTIQLPTTRTTLTLKTVTDYEAAKKQFDIDLKEYNLLASELRPISDKFLDYERQLGTISETSPAFPELRERVLEDLKRVLQTGSLGAPAGGGGSRGSRFNEKQARCRQLRAQLERRRAEIMAFVARHYHVTIEDV